ncbi:MAG TPA: hypothetical protein DEA91_19285 [Paenibacillus sp.]|nr:hypothetical protein [Paenibacillus sp.]
MLGCYINLNYPDPVIRRLEIAFLSRLQKIKPMIDVSLEDITNLEINETVALLKKYCSYGKIVLFKPDKWYLSMRVE